MRQNITRREALKKLWGGAKAVGKAYALVQGADYILPLIASAEEKPQIDLAHSARGHVLTLDGHLDHDMITGVDKMYHHLKSFLKDPVIVNSNITLEKFAPFSDNEGRSAIYRETRTRENGDQVFDFYSRIYIADKDVESNLAHEYGHCFFEFMKFLVSPEWVRDFDKAHPVKLLQKLGYEKSERQGEVQADVFRGHILGKRDKNIAKGLQIYDNYINSHKGDPRVKIIRK